MDDTTANLDSIQASLTRYGMTTYLILGNIGLFFNINIFSQPTHRRNSSSLYLLLMSICHFLSLNFGTIPYIYALNHTDLLSTSLIFCKIQFYFRHTPYQILRTLMILACLNRYISSHIQHRLQFFNQYHFTLRCIIFVVLFWLVVCIFIPILLSIDHGICEMIDDTSALIYSIYLLIFAGILPPVFMTISSLLIIYNLKQLRSRVHPIANKTSLMRRRDRDYIRMLLVEILIYIVITLPYTSVVFYITILQFEAVHDDHNPRQLFLTYMTRSFFVYFNNALPFWIYLLMSKSFRHEFKDLLIRWSLLVKDIFR